MMKLLKFLSLLFLSYTQVLLADITPGVTINFDASDDPTGDATWAANVGGGLRDWTLDGNYTPVAVADADTPGITQAYYFNDNLITTTDYTGLGDQSEASFEIWFKVDNNITGGKVIFESGGATDGCFIRQYQSWISVGAKDNDFIVLAAAELNDYTDRHHQMVVVYDFDGGGGNVSLYIDGQFTCSDYLAGWGDWSGTNDAGLASLNDAMPFNGPIDGYKGEISIFRFYQNKALSASEVLDNYNAVAVTAGASVVDTFTLNGENEIDIIYNADNPGIDPDDGWAAVPETAFLGFLNPFYWSGPDPPLISIEDRRVSSGNAFNMTGADAGSQTFDWPYTEQNALIELWVKPDDLSGSELIFEMGGATDGSSLVLDDNLLSIVTGDDYIPMTASYELSNDLEGQFLQLGTFFNIDDESVHLYVNGNMVSSNTLSGWADYAGTDSNGLGGMVSAFGGNVSGYSDFNGLISYMRFYTFLVGAPTLSQANTQISNNYLNFRQGRGTVFSIK